MPIGLIILLIIFGAIFIHASSQVKVERRDKIRGCASIFRKYVKREHRELVDYSMASIMIDDMKKYVGEGRDDFHQAALRWASEMRLYLDNKEPTEIDVMGALALTYAMDSYADNI